MRSPHLATLETLLRSRSNPNEPEVRTALAGLSSEIKDRLRIGRPSAVEFLVSSARALSRLRGVGQADIRLSCLADIGLFFVTQGYPGEAIPVVSEITSLAKSTQDHEWIRKAELLRGLTNAELGNIADAVVCYANGWQMAQDRNNLGAQAAALCNLGAALNYGVLYREAIPCFQLGIEFARTKQCREELVRTGYPATQTECAHLNNLAQSYLYLGQFDQGFNAISECLTKTSEPFDARTAISRIIHEFTFCPSRRRARTIA